MPNLLDQIEIKFKDGAPLWVYIQELVPLSTPDGTIVSYTPNRTPIEPSDPRVQSYLGEATASAIAQSQKDKKKISDLQSQIDDIKSNNVNGNNK